MNRTSNALSIHDVYLDIESSRYPSSNLIAVWHIQKGVGSLDNDITLKIGPSKHDPKSTLTFYHSLSLADLSYGHRVNTKTEMTLPSKGLDLAFALGHDHTDVLIDTNLYTRFATEKEMQCGIMFHMKPGVSFEGTGAFNLTLPGQPIIRLAGMVKENQNNNYTVSLYINILCMHTRRRLLQI